jgi:hypothetical protein
MPELWRLDRNLGSMEVSSSTNYLGTMAETGIPPGFTAYAQNVRLNESRILEPRAGLETLSTSGGPTASIRYVFVERINGTEAIWTVTGTSTLSAFRSNSSVSLSDTTADGAPSFAAHNGKVFMAYNSDANRLHVYAGGVVRRVGLAASAAATVANTGAGAYAATIRYYKIQWRIYDGATGITSATSELSPVVSFTPSGAGTAARVTKPTTVDSATHWCVYGSSDGTTFYNISGLVAVGTTTYDDTTDPSAYSGGVIAPEAGLYVPPPSCKYLASNGERLILAGAWETTAASGQTTPSPRRVWFTRPLGVTDAGDDESITLTGESRYYLDINNEDGSEITGLASTVDGSVYVFTKTSVWRLVETGTPDTPFRPERVASGVGAAANDGIVAVDSTSTSTGVYFMSDYGPYRYSPAQGLEWLGEDWVIPGATFDSTTADAYVAGYDPGAREVLWSNTTRNLTRVLRVDYLQRMGGHLRGGWSRNKYADGHASTDTLIVRSMATYAQKVLIAGTALDGGDLLASGTAETTDLGATFSAQIITPTTVFAGGTRNARIDEPIVWKSKACAMDLTYTRNFGGTDGGTLTDSLSAPGLIGGEATRHAVKVEGLAWSDAQALSLTLSMTSALSYAPCDLVVVPYTVAEAL